MNVAQQTANVVAALPDEKAQAVLEYAQYLAEKADDEVWQAKFDKAADSPRFAEAAERARSDIALGKAKPMDTDRL